MAGGTSKWIRDGSGVWSEPPHTAETEVRGTEFGKKWRDIPRDLNSGNLGDITGVSYPHDSRDGNTDKQLVFGNPIIVADNTNLNGIKDNFDPNEERKRKRGKTIVDSTHADALHGTIHSAPTLSAIEDSNVHFLSESSGSRTRRVQ